MLLDLKYNVKTNTWQIRRGGFLFVLDRKTHDPGTDWSGLRRYMVSRLMPGDFKPRALILHAVDEAKHTLIDCEGFTSDSRGRVLARCEPSEKYPFDFILPGRAYEVIERAVVPETGNFGWKVPIFHNEVDALFARADFVPDNWTPNPRTGVVAGFYINPKPLPQPTKIWVDSESPLAIGVQKIDHLLVYADGKKPDAKLLNYILTGER